MRKIKDILHDMRSLHITLEKISQEQHVLNQALIRQQNDINNLNELLRRDIHDTNAGFFRQEHVSVKEFGGKHATYNDEFYRNNQYDSVTSGIRILRPIFKRINVRSVVDFGCGTGTWLYAAKKLNVTTVLGFDGDYVNRKMLLIEESEFVAHDLNQPIRLEQKFDMAFSVEVAEHLPETSAGIFLDSICSSSDIVLFSAAHVGQGGDDHINEQPISYWQALFAQRGYRHIEIRPHYQGDWEIQSWYRDNIGLYVKEDKYMQTLALLEGIASNPFPENN